MKAIVQDRYGPPDVLALREIDVPRVDERGILVEVHAASVNALDWHTMRGRPFLIRLSEGVRRPRARVRGVDLAGRVLEVGSGVTRFRPGDAVFGGSSGSFAEYTVTTADRLAPQPPSLTHAQAATLHVCGLTAVQGLRDAARVQPGQHVLINGAGGGVGTFAVQVAKWLGARVTALTRAASLDLVRSLGADDVIDHDAEDFTRRGERYDVVFDIGGTRPFAEVRRVLTRHGALVAVGAPAGRWLAPATRMLAAAVISPFVSQRLVPFLSKNDEATLALVAQLAADGTLRPVIDRTYALGEAAEALRYIGTGHVRGKVVVNVR